MTRVHVRRGWEAAVLRRPGMDAARKEVGESIADKVRDQGITVGDRDGGSSEYPLPVKVFDDGTVALAHPAGIAVQAKHGTLTRAAAAAGFEVRS